jgi:hypothetical protein
MRSDAVDIYWVVRSVAIGIASFMPVIARCAFLLGVFMGCIKPMAPVTVNLD